MSGIMTRHCTSILLLFLLLSQGCAAEKARRAVARLDRPEECQTFLLRMDELVDKAGVRDASSFRVEGFPYLRVNRFLAAMRYRVQTDSQRHQWLSWMKELDFRARDKEISNLPQSAIASPQWNQTGLMDRAKLSVETEACASRLYEHDRSRPEWFPALSDSIRVPREYSFVLRAVGLYPITSLPVDVLGEKQRRKFRKWYETDLSHLSVQGELKWFAPSSGHALSREERKALLRSASKNPLEIPLPGGAAGERLARGLAPVYLQDVAARYDLPGSITRKGDGFAVETASPTVYYYFSHAFLRERPILQVNYVFWVPRRTGPASPWLERGKFDGLTTRVSLDPDGEVFMVDMMNNCGCYHFFVPRRDRVERILAKPLALDPFVPQWLPDIPDGERLTLRINSGWHQVQRLFAASPPGDAVPYELVPYEEIESLTGPDGTTKSLFNSDGIIESSRRIEPLILFPVGIPDIGAMRQRGHHAIESRGDAHFDDPYLFEESFVFKGRMDTRGGAGQINPGETGNREPPR